jgi:hypothetical protein
MIKFFRSIRKKLIEQGKTANYLKYAIGEIVLVVIGILIALSINNWNQERIQNSKSQELLKGIRKDLDKDITTLIRMINHYENRMSFFERHLPSDDFSNLPTDTLEKIIDGYAGSFYHTTQSYEKVKNLGISQICSDSSLSERIDNYYSRSLEFTKIIVQHDQNKTIKDAEFWANDQFGVEIDYQLNMKIPILQESLERRKNLIALISSPRGRNHIKMEVFRKELVLEHHYGIRENAETLRADIEAFLEQ